MVYYQNSPNQNPPDKILYFRYLLIYFKFFGYYSFFFTINITPNPYPRLVSGSQF